MTVAELVETLKSFDQDTEVVFSYNYGDHSRTQVAQKVRCVEDRMAVHSSYHNMDMIVDQEDEDDVTDAKMVIAIS